MQAAGGIDDDDVRAAGLRCLNGVEHHSSRVGALFMLDDVHTRTLRPDGELVGCGGAERIRRREEHTVALFLELGGELADRRRLADAVDADDEHDRRLRRKQEHGVLHLEDAREDLHELFFHLGAGAQLLKLDGFAQLRDGLGRRFHAGVGEDERFLKVFEKFLVARLIGGKNAGQLGVHLRLGLGQTLFDLIKKSHRTIFSVTIWF